MVTDPRTPRALAAPQTSLTPGAVFAERYEIRDRLGAGGMGTVWRVHDRALGEDVALKVLSPDLIGDPNALERFRREVKVARSISHPNVCRVFDLGESAGVHFLTMALVEGKSLRALLAEGAVPADRALALVRQIVAGVAAAHAEGILHRDLKPENVVVQPSDRAVVVDFGLARAPFGEGSTTMLAGTPAYMSPEQLRGEPLDLRSDVFACGLLAHEIFTGRSPFGDGTPASVVSAILRDKAATLTRIELAPEVGVAVARVVHRALAKSRDDRFASAVELGMALDAAALGANHGPQGRARRARVVLGFTLAAAVAVVSTWMAIRDGSPVDSAGGKATGSSVVAPATPPRAPDAGRPSLRVTSVRNLTGDSGFDATCASMRESLNAALRTISGIRIETTYAAGTTPTWTLAGTLQRVSTRLRLGAQITATDGGDSGEPLEVDTDAAQLSPALESLRERVRDEAWLMLRAHQRRERALRGTNDETARARLVAYYRMIGPSPKTEHLGAGERLLSEAIARDAAYVPARVELAYLRLVRASSQRVASSLEQALEDLARAIAIAPNDAPARVMRCRALQFALEFKGAPTDAAIAEATRECGLALELDPDSVPVRMVLARLHDRRCEDDAAMETLERALEKERAYAGRILEHLIGLAMQNERLPLADTLSRRLLDFEAEERRLGPRAASRRSGVAPSTRAALVRGGVLLRLGRSRDARAVLRMQLDRSTAGLGDKAVEAASIRGLLRAGARGAAIEKRLREIEAELETARRSQPSLALRVAADYSWTDAVAAVRWVDKLARPGSCIEAIGRAIMYLGVREATKARAALRACVPTAEWEKKCAAFVETRLRR